MKTRTTLFLLLIGLSLTGCFMPEKFTAKISVNPDSSYSIDYEGTVAFIPALMQMSSTHTSLTSKDESGIKKEEGGLRKIDGANSVKYIENGRFSIAIHRDKKAKEPFKLLDMFQVQTEPSGAVSIFANNLNPKDLAAIKDLGLKMDGKLVVTLPEGAKVLSTNGSHDSNFFGLISSNSYSWQIRSFDSPSIRFSL
jgi:hypothetical protein